MSNREEVKIALVGNPNCGKTSVFNILTGLRQKTGNFPGITVDKKIGKLALNGIYDATLIDLPGTYSLYPISSDERIVIQSLLQKSDSNFPELVVYVVDSMHLEKNLLLFTQIRDLGIPVVLALNMTDLANKNGIQINTVKLAEKLKTPVVRISGRTGEGIEDLKQEVINLLNEKQDNSNFSFYKLGENEKSIARQFQKIFPEYNEYQSLLIAHHYNWLPIGEEAKKQCKKTIAENNFDDLDAQVNETMKRFNVFEPIVKQVLKTSDKKNEFTKKIDSVLTNNFLGMFIFLAIMIVVFQSIFELAAFPMDLIDNAVGNLASFTKANLPSGWFTNLLTDGLIAGIGGIVIFIPQIAILFFFISILEEVGYLARVAYMLDNVMQKFGLNGRSVVALISGGACAIPAIMSTRTISNPKERLITILVTPFISCSARIPVYAILIAFVVPRTQVFGFFNMQGLVFMTMYLLGILAALGSAFILSKMIGKTEQSFLLLELPDYKMPSWRNIMFEVWEKVRQFLFDAGKIIIIISVLLWFSASYGPPKQIAKAEKEAIEYAQLNNLNKVKTEDLISAKKLEVSYIGYVGKFIEPAIKPLGYDWKIGIALISSFAAREVFVGTMATIYSIGSEEEQSSIQQKMRNEINPETGGPRFTLAVSLSLLIFYVFAMQCMGTLAVVYRETKTWKYPIYQFVFMTGFAYLFSLVVYQVLK
ncbi:MAG: ferrous iron transport protein B [Chitinophagales bacterium]